MEKTNAAMTYCRLFSFLKTHISIISTSSDTGSVMAKMRHHITPAASHSTTNAMMLAVHIDTTVSAIMTSTLYPCAPCASSAAAGSPLSPSPPSVGASHASCDERR